MKNLVQVEILGREYTVKSDEGEERVRKIAEYINRKIKEVSENSQTVTTLNVAILAVLNIANDYFNVIENQSTITQAIEAKSNRLIELIDSQINVA